MLHSFTYVQWVMDPSVAPKGYINVKIESTHERQRPVVEEKVQSVKQRIIFLDKLIFFHFQMLHLQQVSLGFQQDFFSSLPTPVRCSGQSASRHPARTSAGIQASGRRRLAITHPSGQGGSRHGKAASPAAQVTPDWAVFWPPPPQRAFIPDGAGGGSQRPAAPPGRPRWLAWRRK